MRVILRTRGLHCFNSVNSQRNKNHPLMVHQCWASEEYADECLMSRKMLPATQLFSSNCSDRDMLKACTNQWCDNCANEFNFSKRSMQKAGHCQFSLCHYGKVGPGCNFQRFVHFAVKICQGIRVSSATPLYRFPKNWKPTKISTNRRASVGLTEQTRSLVELTIPQENLWQKPTQQLLRYVAVLTTELGTKSFTMIASVVIASLISTWSTSDV